MSANTETSPRIKSKAAAVRYAESLGYQKVGKYLMNGNKFALVVPMPASGTFRVIEGVPTR